ncbi:MAG: CpsD/CapB family tyrosine-protein kinase, partial [Actinobacteria bacterium]|nr:CpsD/CapB family tyrosine-protein kinase [Actinomycetota bacterium]
ALRRPMVHEYLGLSNDVGLASVRAGACDDADALQLVRIDDFAQPGTLTAEHDRGLALHKNLYCLPSGPLPPNPAELLGSARMAELIERLTGLADYVVIDTPPVLLLSDALILAQHADGVVITARMSRTTTDEAAQVRVLLERTGAHVLGVVAGGVRQGGAYYYRRGYYSYSSAE